ncbi:MAG: POTRA domain-containing protein [Arsenophonus endosymbiont of Dermacentor nuttalli]
MVTNLQNRLISRGWITSRVFVPVQDLSTRTLKLVVIAGKVAKVIFTSDSSTYSNLYALIPTHKIVY